MDMGLVNCAKARRGWTNCKGGRIGSTTDFTDGTDEESEKWGQKNVGGGLGQNNRRLARWNNIGLARWNNIGLARMFAGLHVCGLHVCGLHVCGLACRRAACRRAGCCGLPRPKPAGKATLPAEPRLPWPNRLPVPLRRGETIEPLGKLTVLVSVNCQVPFVVVVVLVKMGCQKTGDAKFVAAQIRVVGVGKALEAERDTPIRVSSDTGDQRRHDRERGHGAGGAAVSVGNHDRVGAGLMRPLHWAGSASRMSRERRSESFD